jgi:hypothetical protein
MAIRNKETAFAERAIGIVASHNAAPPAMKPSAVRREMRGQPGTRLVRGSTSKVQPTTTNKPTASATNAANCAKNRFGSALTALPMKGKLLRCVQCRN